MTEQEDLRREENGAENVTTVEETNAPAQKAEAEPAAGVHPPPEDAAGKEKSDEVQTGEEAKEAENGLKENPLELEIRQLRQQLEAAREEAEANYQRFLRAQADFENFRRRTRQEKEDMMKYAAADLIASLLPVIDNFERALEAGKASDPASSLLQGVEMIYKQLKDTLASAGLEEIDCLGKPFDPFQHEAVMREPSEEHEEGTVIEVFQKGYRFKERVIRPAMVKVSG